MRDVGPEISDEIVSYDPVTLERRPVVKQTVIEGFMRRNNRRAARIVGAIPDRDGVLDPEAVDRMLVLVHCELQRISEEFQHGRRVAELLRPMIASLAGVPRPIRIVDIGCGTGYVLRWLAMHGGLGDDVELLGADYNRALVDEAARLASIEKLRVRFLVANAFRLEQPASIFMSTGVVHHFRGDDLVAFFASHDQPTTHAFVHFDFQPSPIAPLGSWIFHAARMRIPLAKHDGVLSAVRAHRAEALIDAAQRGAPGFVCRTFGTHFGPFPLPRAMHAVLGIRPEVHDAFVKALGARAGRLGT